MFKDRDALKIRSLDERNAKGLRNKKLIVAHTITSINFGCSVDSCACQYGQARIQILQLPIIVPYKLSKEGTSRRVNVTTEA